MPLPARFQSTLPCASPASWPTREVTQSSSSAPTLAQPRDGLHLAETTHSNRHPRNSTTSTTTTDMATTKATTRAMTKAMMK